MLFVEYIVPEFRRIDELKRVVGWEDFDRTPTTGKIQAIW